MQHLPSLCGCGCECVMGGRSCEYEKRAQKFLQQVFTPEVTLNREKEEEG